MGLCSQLESQSRLSSVCRGAGHAGGRKHDVYGLICLESFWNDKQRNVIRNYLLEMEMEESGGKGGKLLFLFLHSPNVRKFCLESLLEFHTVKPEQRKDSPPRGPPLLP